MPDDGTPYHGYGRGLAIHDAWIAIGADEDDEASPVRAGTGAVYMYAYLGGGVWNWRQKLMDPGTYGGEHLGFSVDMDAGHVVGGAFLDGEACGQGGCDAGSAIVFRRVDPGTPEDPIDDSWVKQQKLVAPDAGPDDLLGYSVSIDGDWIVVGAPIRHTLPASGFALIFHRDDNGTPEDPTDDTWALHTQLTSPGAAENPDDHFGYSVAIRGQRIVVSAPFRCTLSETDYGSVYVFRRDDSGTLADVSDDDWVLENTLLPIRDTPVSPCFGFSVAMSDDVIAVGAPYHEILSPQRLTGAAYVFRRNDAGTPADGADDTWQFEDRLIMSDQSITPDLLGWSVAISGDRIVAGAPGYHGVGFGEGAAYVFRRAGGQWHEEQKLADSESANTTGEFGADVAIENGTILVGDDNDDEAAEDAGAVYRFEVIKDCNGDCVSDADEMAAGAPDCNANNVPDYCDVDCNNNLIPDECDLAAGTSPDCNANAVPDECDIASGFSRDCTGDTIPDECAAVCTDDCECNDFSPCTWDVCVEGACGHTASRYGDVTGEGTVNLLDIFGMLDQMAGANNDSTLHVHDIYPCAGDGVVNLFDVFAALDAIAGVDPCCGG